MGERLVISKVVGYLLLVVVVGLAVVLILNVDGARNEPILRDIFRVARHIPRRGLHRE